MTSSERAPAAAGFTLLEMLVVLLIAGFALLLTTQAIGQYQRTHARVSVHERAGREYRLAEAWFRDSARALVAIPDQPLAGSPGADPPIPAFEGQGNGFTGVTLAPVLAGQGMPARQSWRITAGPAGRDVLELEEGGRTILLPFPGDGRLVLHYMDADGSLHDRWPPLATGEEPPQLPAAVVLELTGQDAGAAGSLLVAAIIGSRTPVEVLYEPEPLL